MKEHVYQLLQNIGPGKMSNLAYDTAWVARLGEIDWGLSSRALNWLCEHQLSDGSWGVEKPFYYHDRVISTLAAMIALTYRGRRAQDRNQIEKGLLALEKVTGGATQGLQADPNGATVGFEMIVPTLIAEAEKLGIIKQQGESILGKLSLIRKLKMPKLEGYKINKFVTPAFSAEMAGTDFTSILDIENLQETNGSVGNSPSATAYYVISLKHQDQNGLDYLHKWVSQDGGTPNVAPFDIFEPAWVLWNLKLAEALDSDALELCKPHLDFIHKTWESGTGIGHASEYTPRDSDDTGLVYELLSWFGYAVDVEAILSYEEKGHFRCFALEANPSISANIHVLGGLRQAGFDKNHSSIVKILNFLRRSRISEAYWLDKWHTSPYYVTSHAIISCIGLDDEICQYAAEWIISTQKPDGAWGSNGTSTAEETAYCLQALVLWRRHGKPVSQDTIHMGVKWLTEQESLQQPYPPLWIGKGLYCPEYVVKATIISALELCEQG